MKNSADYFTWVVESIETNKEKRNIVVTLTGFPENECIPFVVDYNLERDINNRMNGKEKELEKELETDLKRRRSEMVVNYNEYNKVLKMIEAMHSSYQYPIPQIKNVIFNYPATIVFWNDDTKTVVKCDERDQFDPEKGITMAFFKKMHGNIGHYFEEIKKWAKKYEDKENKAFKDFLNYVSNSIDWSVEKTPDNPRWHIWYKIGMLDEIHCYEKDYSTKYSAVRRAKKLCECDDYNITIWAVSQKAPFGPESDDVEWHLN